MELVSTFLPIVLVIGFWIFLMYKMKKNSAGSNFAQKQDQIINLLSQINEELKELNNKKS